MGFHRTMPVTGRILNITSDIYQLTDEKLRNTFFTSSPPDTDRCFFGSCKQYCKKEHAVCAKNELIEVNILLI